MVLASVKFETKTSKKCILMLFVIIQDLKSLEKKFLTSKLNQSQSNLV